MGSYRLSVSLGRRRGASKWEYRHRVLSPRGKWWRWRGDRALSSIKTLGDKALESWETSGGQLGGCAKPRGGRKGGDKLWVGPWSADCRKSNREMPLGFVLVWERKVGLESRRAEWEKRGQRVRVLVRQRWLMGDRDQRGEEGALKPEGREKGARGRSCTKMEASGGVKPLGFDFFWLFIFSLLSSLFFVRSSDSLSPFLTFSLFWVSNWKRKKNKNGFSCWKNMAHLGMWLRESRKVLDSGFVFGILVEKILWINVEEIWEDSAYRKYQEIYFEKIYKVFVGWGDFKK